MLQKLFIAFILSVAIYSCKNIEDADPTARISFVRFYGTGLNHEGVMALPDADDGFILIGNVRRGDTTDITVIKTDDRGNSIWETVVPNGFANSVIITDNGYFITGDRVFLNDKPGIALSELRNTQAHIFKISSTGNLLPGEELIIFDNSVVNDDDPVIDFRGHASVVVNDSLYVLGSFKLPQQSLNQETYETGFIAAYPLSSISSTSSPAWSQNYIAQSRDFKNANTLHFNKANNFIWANTYSFEEEGLSRKDAHVYIVPKNSINTDNDALEETTRSYAVADMQPSTSSYGLVGTYAQLDGSASNIFFARYQAGTDKGEITQVKYFDGVTMVLPEADKDQSTSIDEGKAITGTRDGGFVLACTFTSTLQEGNGGKDILLIKVDAFGNFIWSETIGGSGDDEPASIRENRDGSLLICGTNKVNGLSSLMLVKTDKQGKLTN